MGATCSPVPAVGVWHHPQQLDPPSLGWRYQQAARPFGSPGPWRQIPAAQLVCACTEGQLRAYDPLSPSPMSSVPHAQSSSAIIPQEWGALVPLCMAQRRAQGEGDGKKGVSTKAHRGDGGLHLPLEMLPSQGHLSAALKLGVSLAFAWCYDHSKPSACNSAKSVAAPCESPTRLRRVAPICNLTNEGNISALS